ncbi:hypothetical protein Rsub_01837 [Raphidocelis subcapitata]|uniref:Uncharacterized protein n=1 Tax=Raphidocelis subcapitata TaxID=307507 RepID=A0A2V0NU78_9CHLO|nr:hypothetical protein Rsub_01837 [Raphidocelis subcapitata]|eukprot:GBF89120.1 hypothetical protein Rsub_01837 [Raphidocelis subcapitata]
MGGCPSHRWRPAPTRASGGEGAPKDEGKPGDAAATGADAGAPQSPGSSGSDAVAGDAAGSSSSNFGSSSSGSSSSSSGGGGSSSSAAGGDAGDPISSGGGGGEQTGAGAEGPQAPPGAEAASSEAAGAAAAGAGSAFSGAGASSSGAGGGGGGGGTVALSRRFRGAGYTFLLAGFLKIITLGGLASSAPMEAGRTAAGQWSGFLLVPVGLGMAWLAKQITDAGLQENPRFLAGMVAVLVFIYFALIKLLYKADPGVLYDLNRRPRARMAGPMAEVRAGAGDRELVPGMGMGVGGGPGRGRTYGPEAAAPRPGERPLMDDLAWYDSRYPDAPAAGARGGGGAGAGGGERAGARARGGANSRSFLPPADEP